MNAAPKLCIDCGVRPKELPRHRCEWCQLRRMPTHQQAEAAARRLAMVPEAARMKRSHKSVIAATPAGFAFCAGCQSFLLTDHFGRNQTQCRGCMNAKSHSANLEKTYGISVEDYDRLLAAQDGKCAICGRKPTGKKRLAVDHSHQTGAVRGLLCAGEGRCNEGLLGSAHDDSRMLWNAYVYLKSPPNTRGSKPWWPYLDSIPLAEIDRGPRAASPFQKPSDSPQTGIVPQKKSGNKLDEKSRWGPGWSTDPRRTTGFYSFNSEDQPF